ncbi:MAG: hypothetical protein QM765_17185 [Myxococcales bacterium]
MAKAFSVSTFWQKAWMVLMEAESYSRSAASSRPCARASMVQHSSGSVPSGAWCSAPPAASRSSRPRTRVRSSPAAFSVKVTTRISPSRVPLSTRSTTRCSRVYVLPVPALASMTACPGGSSRRTCGFL